MRRIRDLELGGSHCRCRKSVVEVEGNSFSNFVVVVAGVVFCQGPFSMDLEQFFFKLWLIVVCAIQKTMAKEAIEVMNFPPRLTQQHLVNWVGGK